MIVSRTPVRISFAGGGTDIEAYYKDSVGACLSTTIDKYIYITVNPKFDDNIRVAYSRVEYADNSSGIKHDLIRNALEAYGIESGIEITSVSDIPSEGTGLGSSSAYTVGLLTALSAYSDKFYSREGLAETACTIEINRCDQPVGKQDQYAAAFGGLNLYEFSNKGVSVSLLRLPNGVLEAFNDNLMLFYTGVVRKASPILKKQVSNIGSDPEVRESMDKMVGLAYDMAVSLELGNIEDVGSIMDKAWLLKRDLASGISNRKIDGWYTQAKAAGATGGKVLGAGGGGFMLFSVPKDKQDQVEQSLELKRVPFEFEGFGSSLLFT